MDQNYKQKDFVREEDIDGIHVHRMNVFSKFMSYFVTLGLPTKLISEEFDVIHAHGYRNFQTDVAAFISLYKKKPLVISLHGMFSENAALERGFGRGQRIYNIYDFITGTFSLRVAKVLLANSQFEYDSIPKFKDKTQIIPLGVDFKKYQDIERGNFRRTHNIKDEKIILYVGRISKGKNIEALIKATSTVSKKHNVKLVIVGEELHSVHGRRMYLDTLIELARDHGLANNIIFTGGLYGDDLLDAYADADIFVNPSLAENFGLTNLEAAACSLPVVASPVGVAPDLLKEHEWLLFKTDKELESILYKLLEDENLRKKIGGDLKKKVKKEYTWDKVAEKTEKIYESLLN